MLKQELAPLIRESITDDTLKAIEKLVGLTGMAVDVLMEDMQGEDRVMAQRAATTVLKYTVGHPAIVKPVDEVPEHITVNFALPRPDGESEPAIDVPNVDEEGNEITDFECDICHQLRKASERVAGSDRCETCFREARDRILARFRSLATG